MKTRSKKGFTLAELLIVIAIIAILVAIMFPVFGAQLNKARAAAELANVRARYSEIVADQMLGDGKDLTAVVDQVVIKMQDLAPALQYKGSVVKVTTVGTPAVYDADTGAVTTAEVKGKITVTYEGYEGSFATDGDVKLTANQSAKSTVK